jgi:CyaY protein
MSAPTSRADAQSLSDSEFHAKADAVLSSIEAALDGWLQQDVIDIDSHRTGGLLELVFPGGSKIVVNTQPPLHELWMAARTGGYHFRWAGDRWVDSRSDEEFFAALSREISAQANRSLTIAPR